MADLKELLNFLGLNANIKLSAWDGRTLKLYPNLEKEEHDVVFQFFTHLSALDHQAIEKLPSSVQHQQESGIISHPINKKDILFAIVSCCDQFLLQDVLSKLHSIGRAVPVIVPCINSLADKKLLCHGLRKCVYDRINLNTGITERIQLVDEEVLCVSAMRIGNIKFSKSIILNALMSKLQNIENKSFYITPEKEPPGSWWSTGTVEAVWYTGNDRHIPSFLLLNARGDGDDNANLQDLFACVCNMNILFVAKEVPESRLRQLTSVIEITSTVVLICENTLSDTLASESVVILNHEKSSSSEIAEHLATVLQENQNKNGAKKSVNNFTQHCKRLGIKSDEQIFAHVKSVARETVHFSPFLITDNAETILPLSKYPKQNDLSGDSLRDDTTRNPKRNASPNKSTALSKFLKLTTYNNDERQIFLSYVCSFFEKKFFANGISPEDYYKSYFVKRTETLKDTDKLTSKDQGDSGSVFSHSSESLKVVEKKVLSVEHFLYELLLMTESTHSGLPPNFNLSELNHCLATWMLNGNSINLFNSDSPHSPFAFAKAAVLGLQSLLGDTSFVRVLSIFGGDWEATCLMLNRMFGARITTDEAMCSRGPRIHLFPVKMKTDESVNFDYLLVILLGTHSSCKITQDMYSEKRNHVLTTLSLLTDVLILHVDKDGPQPEETTAFDMVAHCMLKRTDKVLHKCCIVYNVKNTLSTNLKDLESYTSSKLQQSCASVRRANSMPRQKDTSQQSVFVRDIWCYFKSCSIMNLKLLPTLRYKKGLQIENEYLDRLYDLRNFILQILKECPSMPHSFKIITEVIALQNGYLKGTESFKTNWGQRFDELKPQINTDNVIKEESISFEVKLKTYMKDSHTSKQKKEQFEACSLQHSASLEKRFPTLTIHEVKTRTKNVITEKLKQQKYGTEVNKLVSEGLRDDLHNLSVKVESMEDVRAVENQFNNVLEKDRKALVDCQKQFENLHCDYTHFEKSANEMMLVLKKHLEGFSVSVNTLTMCIFLCIKFIFKIHRLHVIADLQRIDKTASSHVVDFGNYVIKYEEPLKYQSLDKKIKRIIPLLKSMFTEDVFSQLVGHLTSENAVNYEHIPFHMQTLQKLDRKFLQLLPVVSSGNMIHILDAVNDAKLYLFGKTLGKTSYNFDESFNYVHNLIKATFTDGPQSEKIKATALVHVIAWSSTLISVKIHQSEKENSISSVFEKLLPILKFNCNIYAKENVQEHFSDTVVNAVRETLMEYIPRELENELKRSLLHNQIVISYKQSFVKYMLGTFCQSDDYLSLLNFVESYKDCSRKWGLVFLAEKINASTSSVIAKIKLKAITRKIDNVIDGVKRTTSACVEMKDETLFSWIQLFQKYLSESSRKVFTRLDQELKFSDINLFCNECCTTVQNLEDWLQKKIELPEGGNMDKTKAWLFSLPSDMYNEFLKTVLGCEEQCPSCGNVCIYFLDVHTSHSAFCHIPIGIKGGTIRTINTRLASLTCTDLMSDESGVTLKDGTEKKYLSLLKAKRHDWDIRSVESNQIVFWKYIFNRFKRQFSQYYECEEVDVPPDWKNISKKEAMESIAESFSVVSKEIV